MNRGGGRGGSLRGGARGSALRQGWGLFVLWLLAALLARGTLSDLLSFRGARPDFLVIVVVYWALASRPVPATVGGFLAGLVADAGLGRGLGLQAGLLSLAGYAVGHAGRRLAADNPLLQAALIAVVAAAAGLARAAALPSDSVTAVWSGALPLILGSALYSAVLGPALFWIAVLLGLPNRLSRVPSEE